MFRQEEIPFLVLVVVLVVIAPVGVVIAVRLAFRAVVDLTLWVLN